MKNIIKIILKFALAAGLIYWLIDTGKMNLSLLGEIFNYPQRLILAFLGTITVITIVAFRFKLIIEHKSTFKIPFIRILKYNWIGMFFNSVLPGSVSGDLVKIFYIKQEDEKLSNQFLLGSILIDRVVGLFGLIIVLGFFTAFSYSELSQYSTQLKYLLDINLLLLAVVVLSFVLLFFFPRLPRRLSQYVIDWPVFNKILPKLLNIWANLCEFKHRMVVLTLVSIVVQATAIFIFWYVVSPFAKGNLPLEHAFTLIPIGLISIAIPISPSGVGVGHTVFDGLFNFINVQNGADLFNIYFVLFLSVNLLGSIPYLINKSKNKEMDLSDLEKASS